MAKIFGVELKSVKTFQGMEGEGVQGNVFIDGQKAGFYNDAGNGGESFVDFVSPKKKDLFNQRRVAYFSTHPVSDPQTGEIKLYSPKLNDQWMDAESEDDCKAQILTSTDAFISEILDLTDAEKTFKKFQRRNGNPVLFYVTINPFRRYYVSVVEDTKASRKEAIELAKKECPKNEKTIRIAAVYNQDSFCIEEEKYCEKK